MVLAEVSQLMGLSLRMSEDQLTRDALAASASVYYCTGGSNGDNPSNLSLSDVQTVVAALMSADGNMILESQIGEDRFGTAPVPDAFVAFAHTDLSKSLSNIDGFTSKWNYPSSATSKVGAEWGVLSNVRFFLSSQGLVSPNATNLGNNEYSIMMCAMEAYGCVYQDNFSSRIIYLGPEFSDPLMQNVTLGYTMAEVSRVYNDLWITQALCSL
jgi:N4-gp56 family major capsid protein